MAKIEFMDWETWQNGNPAKRQGRGSRDYLRDDKRVIGEWRRVFQYLVLPSRPSTVRAYDVFVDEASMKWELSLNPKAVKVIRCQVDNWLRSSPNFEYKIMNFPVNEFRKICEDLQGLAMPPVFSNLIYQAGFIDGSHYEFEFNSPVLRLRYHWTTVPTEEIRVLADYCSKLARNFETHLEQADKYE